MSDASHANEVLPSIEISPQTLSWLRETVAHKERLAELTLRALVDFRSAQFEQHGTLAEGFYGLWILEHVRLEEPPEIWDPSLPLNAQFMVNEILCEIDRVILVQEPGWLEVQSLWPVSQSALRGFATPYRFSLPAMKGEEPTLGVNREEGTALRSANTPQTADPSDVTSDQSAVAPLLEVTESGDWEACLQDERRCLKKAETGGRIKGRVKGRITKNSRVILSLVLRSWIGAPELPNDRSGTLSKITTALESAGLSVRNPGSVTAQLVPPPQLGPNAVKLARDAFQGQARFLRALEDIATRPVR